MIEPLHIRKLIRKTLPDSIYSEDAEELLMGTFAVESKLGTYLYQINGPALGMAQMERPTFEWLVEKYGKRFGISDRKFYEMAYDLKLNVLMARLRYLVDKNPLPSGDDLIGMAKYWKRVYNTEKGKGTVFDFVEAFLKYCSDNSFHDHLCLIISKLMES